MNDLFLDTRKFNFWRRVLTAGFRNVWMVLILKLNITAIWNKSFANRIDTYSKF